jgi:hypothetical protein
VIVVRRTIQGRFATVAVGVGTAVAAAACVLAGPGTAVAQNVPHAASSGPLFVNTDALPHGARFGVWHGGTAIDGVPGKAPFCLGGEFDAHTTKYRTYSASPKVAGQEYLSVQPSAAAATALVNKLDQDLRECYKSWLSLNIPAYHDHKRSASWEKYASSNADGTMTVYGVFTVPPKGYDPATHLFGVGREGNTVMVLHLSMPGTRSTAPVEAFTQSANTALQVMYP